MHRDVKPENILITVDGQARFCCRWAHCLLAVLVTAEQRWDIHSRRGLRILRQPILLALLLQVKVIDFGAACDLSTGINFNPEYGMLDPRYSGELRV